MEMAAMARVGVTASGGGEGCDDGGVMEEQAR